MLVCDLLSFGVTVSEMTGSGTYMLVVLRRRLPSVKVSPVAVDPDMATMSRGRC